MTTHTHRKHGRAGGGAGRTIVADMRLPGEILGWLPVGAIPIASGMLRLTTYQAWLGESLACVVSSGVDAVLVFLYARWLDARRPAPPRSRGVLWLALTTTAHFGLGLAVFGMTIGQLADKYRLWEGELWGLVSLVVLVAPWLARKLR